ncbi:MAG: BrnT family toxin [Patescibacteria group bacterium]
MNTTFEWDEDKNRENFKKHKISFWDAQKAFLDRNRLIFKDIGHSAEKETRYYCLGKIKGKVCTVRFTYRKNKIRIFGAGYWRKERKIYEKQI